VKNIIFSRRPCTIFCFHTCRALQVETVVGRARGAHPTQTGPVFHPEHDRREERRVGQKAARRGR